MPEGLNKLYEYIMKSELRVVNDHFYVRLAPELAKKYDAGVYDNALKKRAGYIDEIRNLGIKYPGRADPIFYMYIVPDDNFIELLMYPKPNATDGGKPVDTCDIDGFAWAYGISQNLCANCTANNPTTATRVNALHELAHLVHSQFFTLKDRMIAEGFAEALPLYTMNYESKFDAHREIIKNMSADDIISPKELLDLGRTGNFRDISKDASFDPSYISSYLFVRGYITKLGQMFNLDRVAATQRFLEIVYMSLNKYEWLLRDLAYEINVDADTIFGKELQLLAQSDIAQI